MEILGGIGCLIAAFVVNKVGALLGNGQSAFAHESTTILCGIPSVLIALAGLGLIWFGCNEMSRESAEKQRREETENRPPEDVTASALLSNPVRTDNLYKDRRLNVTGKITSITKSIVDIGAEVILNGEPSENKRGFACKFNWHLSVESLSIGQTVTIQGIYRYDCYMENCTVYDLHPSTQSYSASPKPELTKQPEPPKPSNSAFDSLMKKALAGDAKAQYELSQAYFHGEITERDDTRGLMWLRQSVDKNYPEALFDLGGMYLNGFLVKQNLIQGASYMRKAAELGHEGAKFVVSMTDSITTPQPSMPDAEYDALRQKANSGDPEAQYKLGMFYFEELHDNKEAVKWLHKAAKNGHLKAISTVKTILTVDPNLVLFIDEQS